MALASFPEDTAKRIVLISDGNENRGNAEEQAKQARSMGVQIDVLPLAKGQRNEDEVLIESIQAPPLTEQGSKVPIRVLIRSFNPRRVGGTLTLRASPRTGRTRTRWGSRSSARPTRRWCSASTPTNSPSRRARRSAPAPTRLSSSPSGTRTPPATASPASRPATGRRTTRRQPTSSPAAAATSSSSKASRRWTTRRASNRP